MKHSRRIYRAGSVALVVFSVIFSGLAPSLAADSVTESYLPVIAPNGLKLPWKKIGGVKVYHLIVEEFMHEFAPGLKARVWGYNKSLPGPLIEAVEGDTVRIYVSNRLPAPTSVHWHGLLLPSGMDGVSGLTQKPIQPGETFRYEFTLRQNGTYMYHSHFDEMTQIGIGTTGIFVIHPKQPQGPRADRDFAIMLGEWKVAPGTERPDPNEMTDFNVLTFNGKAFPATAPLVAKLGDRVRIRVANLSTTHHHPIHLHGYQFKITETDGGRFEETAQIPETTVLTPVGSTRTVEFVANEPGDWALHCHMTHHAMNQMGHGLPNTLGVDSSKVDKKIQRLLPEYMTMGQTGMGGHGEHMAHMRIPENTIPMLGGKGPFGAIEMGGMFTILKVRETLESYDFDPGWFDNPPGTVAGPVTDAELQRDLGDITLPKIQKKSQDRGTRPLGHHH